MTGRITVCCGAVRARQNPHPLSQVPSDIRNGLQSSNVDRYRDGFAFILKAARLFVSCSWVVDCYVTIRFLTTSDLGDFLIRRQNYWRTSTSISGSTWARIISPSDDYEDIGLEMTSYVVGVSALIRHRELRT